MLETPRSVNRLSTVQALRAIAASLVVVYHAIEASLRNASNVWASLVLDIAWLGNFGVDIFLSSAVSL